MTKDIAVKTTSNSGWFIPDSDLMKITTGKSPEQLVNIGTACPGIIIRLDPESKELQHLGENECYVRKTVAEKLLAANKELPAGIHLMIWDGYRSIVAQQKMYTRIFCDLRKKHPLWSEDRLVKITDKFIANPQKICLHATGGVVDLTLCDTAEKELDMGSAIDSFDTSSAMTSALITDEARKNRALLRRCLEKQGFINYPPEWWRWGYGDAYWAATMKKESTIYGYVDEQAVK